MNTDNRVTVVVLTGKQCTDFGLLYLLLEAIRLSTQLGKNILSFHGKIQKGAQVGDVARQLRIQLNVALEETLRLQDRLNLFVARPKVGLSDCFFYLGDFRPLMFYIKDNLEPVRLFA
jgi:hypothetical protein